MKNHAELLSAILAIRFDFLRVNDLVLSDDIYRIDFYTAKNSLGVEYEGNCLVNANGDEFPASDAQLAALRCAKGPITAEWLDQFLEDVNGMRLKTWLVDHLVAEPTFDLKTLQVKVVAQVKVRNTVLGGDTPVYKDNCYTGATAFKKSVTALCKGHAGDRKFYSSAEYRIGMAEYRETLHATPLKAKVDVLNDVVKLPIFQIV